MRQNTEYHFNLIFMAPRLRALSLMFVFLWSTLAFAQVVTLPGNRNCPGVPGACGYPAASAQAIGPGNQSPQNGNGTLGVIYDQMRCGLNYASASQRLGRRGSLNGVLQPAPFAISGIPTCAVIERAYLWAEGSGNGAAQTATINGPAGTFSFPMAIVGQGPDKCWGYAGSFTYRADVTTAVNGNGVYNISGILTNPPIAGNDMDGATLLVIYSVPSQTWQGRIVIADGAIVINGGVANYNMPISPAICGPTTNGSAFFCVGDIQFNPGSWSANGTPAPLSWNWWNYVQVNTTFNNNQTTCNFNVSTGGDCFNLCVAAAYWRSTNCMTCPLSTGLTLTTTFTNATCSNCNGTATVSNVVGGSAPYSYSWAPSGGNAATATGLCPGTYTVTVTDASLCNTSTAVITITTTGGGVTLSGTETNASCNGVCDGSSINTVTGGTPPYTFTWSSAVANNTVAATNTASGLCAGTYTLTVTDANNCSTTRTVTIAQPSAVNVTLTTSPSTCGLPNGSASAIVTGGTGPYTFLWTPSGCTTASCNNLVGGAYSVNVTDANGCPGIGLGTVNSLVSPTVTVVSTVNVLCFGLNTGSAAVSSSGGTNPITYSWSNGDTDTLAGNLTAGTYTVIATDASGCTDTAVVTINEPPQLTATTTQIDVLCFGDNTGSATVTPNGGTAPYSYAWSSGGTGATEGSLIVGTYTCDITDANGCIASVTVTITEPPQLTATATSTNVTCFGASDGTGTASVAGGTQPYTYAWSTGGTAATEVGMGPGQHTCNITDANGCTTSITVTITEPAQIVSQTTTVDAFCNQPNGSAAATASGGTGTLTYNWIPGNVAGQNLNNVVPGTYSVIVTDSTGCSDTLAAVVGNVPGVTATAGTITDVSCFGGADGSATVNAQGGTLPYTFVWVPNVSTSNTASGLTAGVYQVTVTDSAGCISSVTITVNQPTQLTVSATVAPTSVCVGTSATLTATVNGGTPTYNTVWMPGNLIGATQTVIAPTTTTYTVVVADANGCVDSATTTLSIIENPVAGVSSNIQSGCAPLCVNFTDVSTIAAPGVINSWTWDFGDGNTSNSQNPNHCYLSAGLYNVTLTVTTAQGCTNTIIMSNYINVFANPVAAFSATPQPTTELNPTIYFTDLSVGATIWNWSFGDLSNASSTQQNPVYTYETPTCYNVILEVSTPNGCTDTASQIICIDPDVSIYVPNAFTPNGDGTNDNFIPKSIGIDPTKYELWIFDRWGNMIFYTDDMAKAWDGTVQGGGGKICQIDTYVWKIKATDIMGKKHNLIGHVSIIR